MTKRVEYVFALYQGSLAEPGDRNPYAGRSLVLAKLWMHGYMRMLRVRIETGPAMQTYHRARAVRDSDARASIDDLSLADWVRSPWAHSPW